MARNYQQSKVYMICSHDKDCIPYIGSSCKRLLSQRMNQHRDDYKKWKKNPEKYSYISSFILFEKYGIENCFIDLIQAFPCSSSDELRARERRWIDDIKCVNLVKKPIRTMEEKIEDDKICKKIYEEKSKEKHKEKYTCDCGSVCRKSEKARHEKTKKHQKYLTKLTICVPAITDLS